jgi:cysteine desulfuration protein SufE
MWGMNAPSPPPSSIAEIEENFALLDEWEDRYRYVIELGRTLEPLTEAEHSPQNKVRGCASQVWLVSEAVPGGADGPGLAIRGDSDAHIVSGLIAILLAQYSGKSAREIASFDPQPLFARLGLRDHLTPQRSNGLASMVERIRADALAVLQQAAAS